MIVKVLCGLLVPIIGVNLEQEIQNSMFLNRFHVPQKIEDIPPVLSVSCGYEHTLIITTDSNLWSFGNNYFGQLCLGNRKSQMKPQKTSFSNILFLDAEGNVYSCGHNAYGSLGIGSNKNQNRKQNV